MKRFTNKVALVTGAAGGIGLAIAKQFAAEGAKVVLSGLDVRGGEIAARAVGGEASFVALDVSLEDSWAAAIVAVKDRHGQLDCLVNNAGFFKPHDDIETTTLDVWRKHFAVNSDGVFLGCKFGIGAMKGKGGAIVNISSGLAWRVITGASAYCASKAAVLATTQVAALHCGEKKYGIRVNAVLPGAVDTEMMRRNLRPGEKLEEMVTQFTKQHPIGRIGVPNDIADAVLFLCSEQASFITGASIAVDGGQTA